MAGLIDEDTYIKKIKKLLRGVKGERVRLEKVWLDYKDRVEVKRTTLIEDKKNLHEAEALKAEGNENFANDKHREALVKYNQALCKAPVKSSIIGLLYANRSYVYLADKRPLQSLENLELAIQHNYPVDLRYKLEQRRIKIIKMLIQMPQEDVYISPKPLLEPEFSHPSHPRLSSIISSAVDIKIDRKNGPKMIAKENLKVGDILFKEPIFLKIAGRKEEAFGRCSYCCKPHFLSLIPCTECTTTMFCKDCLIKFREMHKLECSNWTDWFQKEPMSALRHRAMIRILGLFDLIELKDQILEWQRSPEKILEGNYASDVERQLVKWIFVDWTKVDIDDWIKRCLGCCFHLSVALKNSRMKAMISSLSKEVTVLQLLFNLYRQSACNYDCPSISELNFQPLREHFHAKSVDQVRVKVHFENFGYCLRPIRKGCEIYIADPSNFMKDMTFDARYLSLVIIANDEEGGNLESFIALIESSMPTSFKNNRFHIPDFDVRKMVKNSLRPFLKDSSKLKIEDYLSDRKQLIEVLMKYDDHYPCFELGIALWCLMSSSKLIYCDGDYTSAVAMKPCGVNEKMIEDANKILQQGFIDIEQ